MIFQIQKMNLINKNSQKIQTELREYIVYHSERLTGIGLLKWDEDWWQALDDVGETQAITPEPALIAQIASEIQDRHYEDSEPYVEIATPTVRLAIAQSYISFVCAYLVSE